MTVTLPPGYKPTVKEEFMNELQQEYFRQKLLSWRDDLLNEASETRNHLQEGNPVQSDLADRATAETDRSLELRTRTPRPINFIDLSVNGICIKITFLFEI